MSMMHKDVDLFFSVDETCFARWGRSVLGYSRIRRVLYVRSNSNRPTPSSVLDAEDSFGGLSFAPPEGAYNSTPTSIL